MKRTRLNVEVPSLVREQLAVLLKRTAATSITEVIRRALSLYEALTARTEGRLIWRRTDGVEEAIVIL